MIQKLWSVTGNYQDPEPHRRISRYERYTQQFDLNLKIEQLFILKACYMGYSIAQRNIKFSALDMIGVAIQKFEQLDGYENKLNLLFYVLLKCEILRGTIQVVELRATAKKIADNLDSRIFDYYMKVQEITQNHMRCGGISDKEHNVFAAYSSPEAFCLATKLTIKIDTVNYRLRLKDIEEHFLFKFTLKEMMEQHEVLTT